MNNSVLSSKYLGEVYSTGNGIFCVSPKDNYVTSTLLEENEYGKDELERIFRLTTSESSVLMLGSHIGTLAIPLSKKIKHLFAVEANPDSFKLFQLNLLLNDCKNVSAFNFAANDENGELEFVMNTVNSGGSKRLPKYRDRIYFYDDPEIRTVPSARMDDLFSDFQFDLVFMDIEGSEYFALNGMPNILSRCNTLITEFLPHHLDRVGGITVNNFLEPLKDFKTMFIPSLNLLVQSDAFEVVLHNMCTEGVGDDGIIFYKNKMISSPNN